MLITYQENYIQFQIKIIYLHRKKYLCCSRDIDEEGCFKLNKNLK